MANLIMPLDDIDILFADYIQNLLGLRNDQVLVSHPEKGQASPKYNETLIFVHTSQIQDDVHEYKSRRIVKSETTNLFTTSQSSMRRLDVEVTLYGLSCDINSLIIKENLYFESGRQFLEKNNMSLIPTLFNISNKVHEMFNGRWWERVDLTIPLYNEVIIEEFNPPFEEVDIDLDTSKFHIVIGG